MCVYVYFCTVPPEARGSMEVPGDGLTVVRMWVLGIEFRSSAGAVYANCQAIYPDLYLLF